MISKKIFFLSLIGLFMFSTIKSCGQKNKHDSKSRIFSFIKIAKNEPVEIFEGWNIWKRSGGFVFDFMDNEFRLLIVNRNKEDFVFKEIFPTQDSAFYSLLEIESRSDYYPFQCTDFSDKVLLFMKLKADQIISINEDSLIMFVNEDYSIIYTQKGINVRELNRYKDYSKYDNNWFYYLKE